MNRRDVVQTIVLLAVAGGAAAWIALRSTSAPDVAPREEPPVVAPPARAPAPRSDGRRHVLGRVVDAEGGRPIGGARVVVVMTVAGATPTWFASDASADGTFDVPLGATEVPAGATLDLRVQSSGYRPWSGLVADVSGAQEVRLEGLARDRVPGRIVGHALDVAQRPVTGPISVRGFDEFLSQLRRSAWADADGNFELEGVPPGTWSLALGDDTERTDIVLAEGAEVRAEFRTRTRFLGEPAFASAAAAKELDDQIRDVAARARMLEDEAARRPDIETLVEIRRRMEDLSRMHASLLREKTRTAPHRAVVLTGIPLGTRAWIAAPGDDGEWVAEVRQATGGPDRVEPVPGGVRGAVRIPWMPLGTARIEVRFLDAPDDAFSVEILPGEGPQFVAVPPR